MFTALNKHQLGILLRNTIQNPKYDGHCMSMTTRNGMDTINPPMYVVDDKKTDPMVIDDVDKNEADNMVVK